MDRKSLSQTQLRAFEIDFLLLFFFGEIFLIEPARGEFGASASAIRAHRLKRSDKFGALRLDHALDLVHYAASIGVCLHAKTAASHKHKLLRVYVHHVRNRGILRRFGAVIIFLTVVSLTLNKMCYSDKVTAEMDGDIVGNNHFDAEVESPYRAMLGKKEFFSPFLCGKLRAGLTNGVEGAELAKHPVLFGGIF